MFWDLTPYSLVELFGFSEEHVVSFCLFACLLSLAFDRVPVCLPGSIQERSSLYGYRRKHVQFVGLCICVCVCGAASTPSHFFGSHYAVIVNSYSVDRGLRLNLMPFFNEVN